MIFLLIALGIATSAGRAIEAAIIAVLAVIAIALLVVKALAWRNYPNGD
jgi:TRAP-type C4-dicarboxylate transport system permease large subunit